MILLKSLQVKAGGAFAFINKAKKYIFDHILKKKKKKDKTSI